MQITNRFAKPCCVCKTLVGTGEGFAAKPNGGRWQTYCRPHAPEQITAKQAPSTARVLKANGFIEMPYEANNVGLLKSMPGARWHKAECDCGCGGVKQWSVSLAAQDRIQVLEVADRLQLNVAPVLRTLEDANHADLPDTLYPFQKKGVAWLSRRDRALLGDDMGLGKTIQILLALGKDDRAIVVCPNTLKYNWEKECNKWRPDFTVRVVSAADRKTSGFPVPKAGQITVVNYDILPTWLNFDPRKPETAKLPKGVEVLKGITLIVDEAHFVGNYKTARAKKVTNLANLVSRVWFATGTVLTTKPGNLWSILSAAGVEREAFGSWTGFKRLFAARTKSRFGGIAWGTGAEIDATVPERLRRVMLRRTRTEVLPDLPRKIYQDIEVNDIPASLQTQLDSVWSDQGEWLEVDSALPGFEEFSKIKAELAVAKIPALMEMIEEHEEQGIPLVVFSDHIAPVDACGSRAGWAVIKGGMKVEDRQAVVDAFQAGQLKGVALTITAGGVGLTLTHAWKVIFNDLNWTPANNIQAEDRICRIGQLSDKCQVTRLVTRHPLEQHINKLIVKKMDVIQAAVDSSIAATAPKTSNGAVSVQGETAAEYADRMEAIRLAAEEAERLAEEKAEQEKVARAKSRVAGILQREQARNPGYSQKVKPLTPARIKSIQDGIRYLASVCDGAVMRDGQGFSKPDAYMGAVLATAGLQTEDELRAAELILIRYSKTQVTLAD